MYNFYKEKLVPLPPRSRNHQILRIMKLTTILLIAVILHVSASSLAQKVTLVEKNAQLVDVFQHIHKQTGYDFLFTGSDLKNAKPVTINAKDEELADVLQKIFEGQSMDYTIENQTVVIKEKEPTLIEKAKALFAQVTVTGKVTDETGQPLVGVTVKIKNTNEATTTDSKGIYAVTVPDDKTIIVFSFIGFETQEYAAKDIPNGSIIKMKASETNLKEVVVSKGYYRTTQELNTGSVSKVTAEVIGRQPVSDPILSLEGRVPGLYISQTSGIPGASYTVALRGKNSIANGNNPLYIVDGVPYTSKSLSSTGFGGGAVGSPGTGFITSGGLSPFNNLNPADIESIEVLKDADATAIYGSRGANGVILITTKKGKAGPTKIDINVFSGVGQAARTVKMLNTQEYLALRHEAFYNDKTLDPGSYLPPDPNYDYDINGAWDTTRYTNWQKLLIGGVAHFTNAQASISGGNANTQFLLGGGYSRQSTVYPGDYSDQKASFHVNINHTSVNQKFHTFFSAEYVNDINIIPKTDFAGSIADAPDAPAVYDANGNLNWQKGTWFNPFSGSLITASATTNNLVSNLNLDYELLPGLQIKSTFGYNRMQMLQSIQVPATTQYGPPVAARRQNNIANTYLNSWIMDPQIQYLRKLGPGKLEMQVGATIQQNQQNSLSQTASGFSSDALIPNIALAPTISVLENRTVNYKYSALFAHVNYNLEDRYILNVTARRDGSSRFGPGNQFGNFGAVGAGWIFGKENFIKRTLPFISYGKLRGSFGTTGNDQITDYQYLSIYSAYTTSTYLGTSTLVPTQLANPYFGWEVVKKWEGAVDLGFLQDRILFSLSYYRNRTGNQLVGYPLPTIAGFTTVQANLPAVVQNSGVEMELNTINLSKSKFRWTTSFNISLPRNKLISYPGLANSGYRNTYLIGQSLFIKPAYHYTGVDPATGLYTFEDVNKDGVMNTLDAQFLKQVTQNYFGGLQNSFSYKGLQLDIFVQFVKQTGLATNIYGYAGGLEQNQPTYLLDRWRKPGDHATYQRAFASSGDALTAYVNYLNSDAMITDASFLRLKNVALSYTLPKSWIDRAHLQSARLYLQAQNLFTITNYKGVDPETQGSALPPLRMITTGIQISL